MRPMPNRLLMLPIVLIVLGPRTLRADVPQPADVSGRLTEFRALLATEQAAAILDLLGDPKVRQAIIQDPASVEGAPPQQATAGEMMDDTLTNIRARLWQVVTRLAAIPSELAVVSVRAQASGHELLRLLGFVLVFLAGGIGAQWLLYPRRSTVARTLQRACTHDGPRESKSRSRTAAIRTNPYRGICGRQHGCLPAVHLATATGSIILGYLLAFTAIRLGLTATRFFLAPGAERLRLVHVSTGDGMVLASLDVAHDRHRRDGLADDPDPSVAWHVAGRRGCAAAVAVAAVGHPRYLHRLDDSCEGNERVRGAIPRLLVSLALVFDWLLFLMGNGLGWTLLILAAIPVVTSILSKSISTVHVWRHDRRRHGSFAPCGNRRTRHAGSGGRHRGSDLGAYLADRHGRDVQHGYADDAHRRGLLRGVRHPGGCGPAVAGGAGSDRCAAGR